MMCQGFFRQDAWKAAVRPSVRPPVRPSVRLRETFAKESRLFDPVIQGEIDFEAEIPKVQPLEANQKVRKPCKLPTNLGSNGLVCKRKSRPNACPF